MKIEFLGNEKNDVEILRNSSKTAQETTSKTGCFQGGYRLDISGNVKDNAAYSFQGNMLRAGRGQGKTALESLQDVGVTDVETQVKYLTVMSNTMSSEDFGRLIEDGFNPARMPAGESVSNLDRIKVKLARAGVHVAGFTDTVDRETAAEITGSAAAANAYVNSQKPGAVFEGAENSGNGVMSVEEIRTKLSGADLPPTDENIRNTVQAMTEAESLHEMDDCSMAYMLKNGLEPTIRNVYEAQYAGGTGAVPQGQGYFAADSGGYYVAKADSHDIGNLEGQIREIIEESGFTADSDMIADAEWIIRNGIPLTKDNLQSYEDMKSVVIPPDSEELMEEIADAIGSGREASDAYLIRGYRLTKQERILSEVRLKMTTEANQALAESDYSIDTKELESEVENLKERERAFYRAAFAKDDVSAEEVDARVDLVELTLRTVDEIREMPVTVIGTFASAEEFTLNEIHNEGLSLKTKYDAASKLYEAVGTEVRPDLGDDISKAFGNVDDILKDMGLETSLDNERAVRILGYNSMEITEENINSVRSADIAVRNLLNRMTPAAAMELIRNNINPLEADVHRLTEDIEKLRPESGSREKYSEYLFKLERNGLITEEETNSYIGIYRLFYQIEKSDGAVIGSLVESGRELSLKNLLQEVRSKNKGRIDINIDNDFAGIDRVKEDPQHMRIDTQIKSAFSEEGSENRDNSREMEEYFREAAREVFERIDPDILSKAEVSEKTTVTELLDILRHSEEDPESTEAYREELSQEIARSVRSEESVYELLVNYGAEVTPDNLLAVTDLLNKRGALFYGIEKKASDERKEEYRESKKELVESLESGDSEKVEEAYKSMTEKAELILDEAEDSVRKRIDLKELQGLHRQISIARRLSSEENYEIPVEINGKVTSINLKLLHGEGESHVDITLETEELGKAEATFQAQDGVVKGFIAVSEESGTEFFRKFMEQFPEALKSYGLNAGEIHMVESKKLNINRVPGKDEIEGGSTGDRDRLETPALYRVARTFIAVLQGIG